jgi:hypothetical protein
MHSACIVAQDHSFVLTVPAADGLRLRQDNLTYNYLKQCISPNYGRKKISSERTAVLQRAE